MQLRPFTTADLDFAAERTAAEQWDDANRFEFESFFAYDPAGCFIAEAAGRRVGMGVATRLASGDGAGQQAVGFVGMLIVLAELRDQGVGHQLLDRAVHHLRQRGCGSIYLDGVARAVPLYERYGFRRVCHSLRFRRAARMKCGDDPAATATIRPLLETDLEAVGRLDTAEFGADRRFFLARRLSANPDLCFVSESAGQISGFISGRRGFAMATAGPLVVTGDREAARRRARELVLATARAAGDRPLNLGVLETNPAAVLLLESLDFVISPNPPSRMVLGEDTRLGQSQGCFAIGSAAKG